MDGESNYPASYGYRNFEKIGLKKIMTGLGKYFIIDNKKWVFAVQCFRSSGLLVSFFIARMEAVNFSVSMEEKSFR